MSEQEEVAANARCLILLGWCAFYDQRWQAAAARFRSALALVLHLKQEHAQEEEWYQEHLLGELETMCLHLYAVCEGRACLLLADDSAWRRSERTLVNDLLKAPLHGSRRVRRPKV